MRCVCLKVGLICDRRTHPRSPSFDYPSVVEYLAISPRTRCTMAALSKVFHSTEPSRVLQFPSAPPRARTVSSLIVRQPIHSTAFNLRLRAPRPRQCNRRSLHTWACRAVGVVIREHVWVIQPRYSCTGESYPGGHGMPTIHFLQKREKTPTRRCSSSQPSAQRKPWLQNQGGRHSELNSLVRAAIYRSSRDVRKQFYI